MTALVRLVLALVAWAIVYPVTLLVHWAWRKKTWDWKKKT